MQLFNFIVLFSRENFRERWPHLVAMSKGWTFLKAFRDLSISRHASQSKNTKCFFSLYRTNFENKTNDKLECAFSNLKWP